ncbi:MAG: hypothetical protein WBG69_06350 [Arcobacteraceae bacterium]
MIKIQDSNKKIISIGHYKVVNILLSNADKDIFEVQDLKDHSKLYTLRILKSNQNPKQIDNEIEILNLLNPYKETLYFYKLEIFSDKLLFIFDYISGKNLLELCLEDKEVFDLKNLKHFMKSMLRILSIYKDNNILHNNIKPENILFDGKDFYLIGLSKAQIDINLDQKSDYYDFISVIYFLVTGKNYEIEYYIPNNIEENIFTIFKKVLENKENITKEELLGYIDKI